MHSQLLFLPSAYSSQNQREKELTYAASKAHAARLAHEKLRQKRKQQTASNLKRPQNSDSDDSSKPKTRLSPLQRLASRVHNESCIIPSTVFSSCDPFDSQLFPIDAVTTQLINFTQVYHRRCWSPPFLPHLTAPQSEWRLTINDTSLDVIPSGITLWNLFAGDQGTLWAVVLAVLPDLRQLVPIQRRKELDRLGLQIKGASFARLRKILDNDSQFEPTLNLFYSVKGLFRESSTSGDLDAARTHANSLQWLIERLQLHEPLFTLLRVAHWGDAAPALKQLRRPVIDYDQWMPKLVSHIWSRADSVLPGRPDLISESLPDCVHTACLGEAFLHVRYALRMSKLIMSVSHCWESIQRRELIFQWLTTKAEHHVCQLLNLYFDLMQEQPQLAFGFDPEERVMEAGLALGVLHVLQKSFLQITVDGGVDVNESSGAIYQPLKQVVQHARQYQSKPNSATRQNAQLWLLYIGALCEDRFLRSSTSSNNSRLDGNELSNRWFCSELAEAASTLGVIAWQDAKPLLSRFILSERLDPEGAVWTSSMGRCH